MIPGYYSRVKRNVPVAHVNDQGLPAQHCQNLADGPPYFVTSGDRPPHYVPPSQPFGLDTPFNLQSPYAIGQTYSSPVYDPHSLGNNFHVFNRHFSEPLPRVPKDMMNVAEDSVDAAQFAVSDAMSTIGVTNSPIQSAYKSIRKNMAHNMQDIGSPRDRASLRFVAAQNHGLDFEESCAYTERPEGRGTAKPDQPLWGAIDSRSSGRSCPPAMVPVNMERESLFRLNKAPNDRHMSRTIQASRCPRNPSGQDAYVGSFQTGLGLFPVDYSELPEASTTWSEAASISPCVLSKDKIYWFLDRSFD